MTPAEKASIRELLDGLLSIIDSGQKIERTGDANQSAVVEETLAGTTTNKQVLTS